MAITSETRKMQYSPNGSTTSFIYSFKIYEDTDLKVIVTSSDGDETELVLNTDYTVTDAGEDTGGTVEIADVADVPYGCRLTILSDMPNTQETVWNDGDDIPASSIQNALDKVTILVQQLTEKMKRAILIPEGSAYHDLTLPDPTADNYLRWNSSCTGISNYESLLVGTSGYWYNSTMTGDEALALSGTRLLAMLNPNGSDRNVTASPSDDLELTIINTGVTYDLYLNPTGINQTIGPGQIRTFYYDITSGGWTY